MECLTLHEMVMASILPKPQKPMPADPPLFSMAPPGFPYLVPKQVAFYTQGHPASRSRVGHPRARKNKVKSCMVRLCSPQAPLKNETPKGHPIQKPSLPAE